MPKATVVRVTSAGTRYEIVSGPHADNEREVYLIRELGDNQLRLESAALVETWNRE